MRKIFLFLLMLSVLCLMGTGCVKKTEAPTREEAEPSVPSLQQTGIEPLPNTVEEDVSAEIPSSSHFPAVSSTRRPVSSTAKTPAVSSRPIDAPPTTTSTVADGVELPDHNWN